MRISAARNAPSTAKPVDLGQHAVEHDRVIAARTCQKQPLAAVTGAVDGIAAFAEALDQIGGGFAIVFDDEELHISDRANGQAAAIAGRPLPPETIELVPNRGFGKLPYLLDSRCARSDPALTEFAPRSPRAGVRALPAPTV